MDNPKHQMRIEGCIADEAMCEIIAPVSTAGIGIEAAHMENEIRAIGAEVRGRVRVEEKVAQGNHHAGLAHLLMRLVVVCPVRLSKARNPAFYFRDQDVRGGDMIIRQPGLNAFLQQMPFPKGPAWLTQSTMSSAVKAWRSRARWMPHRAMRESHMLAGVADEMSDAVFIEGTDFRNDTILAENGLRKKGGQRRRPGSFIQRAFHLRAAGEKLHREAAKCSLLGVLDKWREKGPRCPQWEPS